MPRRLRRRSLDDCRRLPVPAWAKVAPEQIAEAKKHGVPVAFENDLGMRFVLIPAGTFLMGSPEDEEGREDDATTSASTRSRSHGRTTCQITEVTNAAVQAMASEHHSSGSHQEESLDEARMPVVQVNHGDAVGVRSLDVRPGRREVVRPPNGSPVGVGVSGQHDHELPLGRGTGRVSGVRQCPGPNGQAALPVLDCHCSQEWEAMVTRCPLRSARTPRTRGVSTTWRAMWPSGVATGSVSTQRRL